MIRGVLLSLFQKECTSRVAPVGIGQEPTPNSLSGGLEACEQIKNHGKKAEMVKTNGGSQTQLWCNLKKSRTHPPERTLPCIDCQQKTLIVQHQGAALPRGVRNGTPRLVIARRAWGHLIPGELEVSGRDLTEDPASAGFPKLPDGETCSTMTDTLWEF